MLVAKTKVAENKLATMIIEWIFDPETRDLVLIEHTFLKLKGEPLYEEDLAVHRVQPYAALHNIDGCRFLEVMGNDKKAGRLCNIEWIEKHTPGGVV